MTRSLQQTVAALRAGLVPALLEVEVFRKSRFDDAVRDFDDEGSGGVPPTDPPRRICFGDLLGDRRTGATITLEVNARALMFLLKAERRSWRTIWHFAQTLRRAQTEMLALGIRRWADLQPADYAAIERALDAAGGQEVERVRLLVDLLQVYAHETPLIDAPRFTIALAPQPATA